MAKVAAGRAIPALNSVFFAARTPFRAHGFQSRKHGLLGLRGFSSSIARRLATAEMTEKDISSLKVNEERLMQDIHFSSQWGTGERWGKKPTETGMSRAALSDSDKEVRDWFVKTAEDLGCTITIDEMGNIFAIRPGRQEGIPVLAGSHLDTQPAGGRYDGILGVTAGLEMLKVLNENWIETEYPVGVVNWTNEEGARFPISMVSSGVWAGAIPLERAHNLQEVGSGTATMKSELARIGYLGTTPASHLSTPMAAHFELHIEQGPILESQARKIGIVRGVQAYRWHTITLRGRAAHTGTTPFAARADALLLASKLIVHSHKRAAAHGALASTGILTLEPGSTNTVPGDVRFSLDVRAPKDDTVDALEAELRSDFDRINAGEDVESGVNADAVPSRPCEIAWTTDSVSPATAFAERCVACVREACASVFGEEKVGDLTLDMTSGAGHDSVYASRRAPTSMIFVPCREGVSHHPEEFATPGDCALGAKVLMESVVRFDRKRVVGWD